MGNGFYLDSDAYTTRTMAAAADKPGNKGAIFRCGALTSAGKLALSPM
jgi:hypothetical protein